MKQNLLVYGAGKLGRQLYHHLKAYYSDSVKVVGFVDDTLPAGRVVIDGVLTVGGFGMDFFEQTFPPSEFKFVFAIGYSSMSGRLAVYERLVDAGYSLFSIVHPRAIVEPDAKIGEGSVVLGGSVIDQGVVLGQICYIDIGVTIGEDSTFGVNNYLSASTVIGGSVSLGHSNFIGMNSTLVNDIKIGNSVFVNAQTLVHKNVDDNSRVIEMHKVRTSSPLG